MLQCLLIYISVRGGNPVQREKREAGGTAPQHTMQAIEEPENLCQQFASSGCGLGSLKTEAQGVKGGGSYSGSGWVAVLPSDGTQIFMAPEFPLAMFG